MQHFFNRNLSAIADIEGNSGVRFFGSEFLSCPVSYYIGKPDKADKNIGNQTGQFGQIRTKSGQKSGH